MNEFAISSNHKNNKNTFPTTSNIANNRNGIETIHLLSPPKTQQHHMTSINVHIKEEHSTTTAMILGATSSTTNDPSYQPATPPLTPKRDEHDKKHQDMILRNQQQHNVLLQSPIKQGNC